MAREDAPRARKACAHRGLTPREVGRTPERIADGTSPRRTPFAEALLHLRLSLTAKFCASLAKAGRESPLNRACCGRSFVTSRADSSVVGLPQSTILSWDIMIRAEPWKGSQTYTITALVEVAEQKSFFLLSLLLLRIFSTSK